MFHHERQIIEERIRAYLRQQGVPAPEAFPWASLSLAKGDWGMSINFFQIAADEARSGRLKGVPVPQRAAQLAQAVAEHLGDLPGFAKIEAVKGYLNFYFDPAVYSQRVLDEVLAQGAAFGRGAPKGQRVMVEFSQPNTHKAFHVGHLRNVILGEAVCRILEAAGYEVVRANYIGDIGLHVIKWLWNYMKYHNGEEPPAQDKTRWMGDLYAEAVRRLDENPALEAEVRALFARWDARDPEIVALWEKTRQWSLEGFEQVYRLLEVHFHRVYFESEVEEPGKELVERMIEMGIATDERPEGPVVVHLDRLLGLEKETYRSYVVLRSDGTSLYATKDLPLAILKFQEYPDLAQSIYVIDVRQSLYLKQIFKTLELMGYEWADRLYHLAYEIVNLPGNVTMSSREGTVVLLDDLVREARARARAVVEEKNPGLDEALKDEVALAVALGAIKYPMLARDNTKIVTFDWQQALDFEGVAAPYIQYAHVRANSILRKVDFALPESRLPTHPLHPAEVELISRIADLPAVVQRAAAEYKPLHIANLAYELARAFNDFYNQCPVLNAEPPVRDFRLRLVAAAKQAIANALGLLAIPAPQVM